MPTYPAPIPVYYTHSGYNRLKRDTLRNMGFCVDDDRFPDPSALKLAYPGKKRMWISMMDYIRMDGGGKQMVMVVVWWRPGIRWPASWRRCGAGGATRWPWRS